MRILVIDVGGTHVKVLATGHKQRVEIPSGPRMTPAKMVSAVRAATVGWKYPATHYVMVDDKPCILAAVKALWGLRVTTVFVRQGHYALDPKILAACPAADLSIERIGAFLNCGRQDLVSRATQVTRGRV